jgi:hypothetical protein
MEMKKSLFEWEGDSLVEAGMAFNDCAGNQ